MDKKELYRDIVNYLQHNELTKTYLEEIMKYLIPSDDGKELIRYSIKEKGAGRAMFVPSEKSINMAINSVNNWLDRQVNDFRDKNIDDNVLRSYMFLFGLTHEISHAYQYLMGEDKIDFDNTVLKNAYKGIFDLMIKKDYILPRPISETRRNISLILYKRRQYFYLVERNANIESTEIVRNTAFDNNRDDVYKLFDDMVNTFLLIGYTDSGIGSIEETYKKILMHGKYNKFYHDMDISVQDRVRYGFAIDDDTRKKVLKYQMKI